ncbi:MAG: hypothetical protein KIT31_34030 [Deltaproteobacteria bacterium]|nr:hypothetical protein [Deltaproteobacteria bacterium]
MSRLAALLIVLATATAHAEHPIARVGGTVGFQQTDRSAWVFGPSLEVAITGELGIRGEAHLELGDLGDPFGPSNIRGGDGPHVNHVMFGPSWRPARYARYQLAAGASAGILVMHSVFAPEHFTRRPAAGVFVQAGKALGPVTLAIQLRFDFSTSVAMGGPAGEDVPTTSGRLNFAFELPLGHR